MSGILDREHIKSIKAIAFRPPQRYENNKNAIQVIKTDLKFLPKKHKYLFAL